MDGEDSSQSARLLQDHDTLTRLCTTVEQGFSTMKESIGEIKNEFKSFKSEVKDEIKSVNLRCPSKLCSEHNAMLADLQKQIYERDKTIEDLNDRLKACENRWKYLTAGTVFVLVVVVPIITWIVDKFT